MTRSICPGVDDAGEIIAGDRLRFELSPNYLMRKLETRGPIEMSAHVQFKDGSESRLRRRHVPQAPVNDALGIEIEMSEKAEHYFNARHQQAHIYAARLTGPDVILFQIVEVEWYHQADGEKLRTRLTDNVMAMPEAYTLTSVATEPFELTARLLFHDGYVQHLTVPVVPGVTGIYQPELCLKVTEVFAGYSKTNHQPHWATYSAIVGDTKVLETIKRVTYLRHPLDGGPAEEPVVREGNRGSWFDATTPHDVTALVELADGQTIRLNNRLRAEAPRSTEAFILRHDPIVAYDYPGGIAHWVRVTGWDFMIDKIRSVRYEAGSFTQTLTFEPGKYRALAVTVPYGSAETVKARIEMEDDRVVELEHPLTEMDRRAFGWTWEQGNYWGDGKWVVETRLTGPLKVLSTIRQRAWFQLRDHAAAFEDLPSWPVQRNRVLLEPGEYAVHPPQLQAESRGEVIHLDAGKIVVKNRPLQRSESLQVVVEKSPRQPPEGNSAEWILRLRGPEREMMQVEHVQYRWTSGEVRRQTTVERRWGELYDGYEWRCFSEQAPAVQATVTLRGGRVIELTRMGHLLPAR